MRITTKNLSKTIVRKKKTITLLKPTTLEIEHGEIVGIAGENGTGKTTLLRLISRIDIPTDGSIKVNGKVIPIINKSVGLLLNLTAYDAIHYFGALYGLKRHDIKSRFGQIMRFADLELMEKEPLYTYSEGMKSRLLISLALHTYPDILVMDEVLATLDQKFVDKLFEYLNRFTKEGKSVVIVEQNIEVLNKYCNRIVTLTK